MTLKEAIGKARQWYGNQQLKPRSMDYREEMFKLVEETCPKRPPAGWSRQDTEKWWNSDRVSGLSAQRRNNLLGTVRKIFKILSLPDPTSELRRARIPRTSLNVPSWEHSKRL